MSLGAFIGPLFGGRRPAEVVHEFGPQVFRHLRRIFGPRADIDDVYQAVFVEVLRSLPSFRGLSKMSTWVRRITWNVAYQEMRMQYRHQHLTALDEGTTSDPHEDVERQVSERFAREKLYHCLGQLDPRQRAVVIMHDVEGKTLRQISHELGRPLPTAASQLYAGRTRLAEMVSGVAARATHDGAEVAGAGQRSPS